MTKLNLSPRYTGEIDDDLVQVFGSKTLARVLLARGIQNESQLDTSVGQLLPASELTGLDEAAVLISQAINERKRILSVS